ncbi:hypothetical protein Purlil1_12513 [Purpureocillium lilacinum]|uniref:Uncharacterized protein n=1 Tax=Purpureocillium lilacinum TaxID=33203 RepID=A0ABR0BGM2_PURLI|nr:hypothetical protein Purlil1_12513 [Purpureocillium lilacinum]
MPGPHGDPADVATRDADAARRPHRPPQRQVRQQRQVQDRHQTTRLIATRQGSWRRGPGMAETDPAGGLLLTFTTESEVEHAEQMLRRHLGKSTERTKKLREQSGHKGHMAEEKTHELRAMHKRLAETEKTKEMEMRRVRIDRRRRRWASTFLWLTRLVKRWLTDKHQMLDLKENRSTTRTARASRWGIIKLYITEMEQTIGQ